MSVAREKFGAFIRREREGREIGLREMKMIGVSPTYLSKVERDEFPPPAEDKVRAIAKIIGCDTDDLLARAGRVSTDITDIIKRHPVELAALLRTTRGLTAGDIAQLSRPARGYPRYGHYAPQGGGPTLDLGSHGQPRFKISHEGVKGVMKVAGAQLLTP